MEEFERQRPGRPARETDHPLGRRLREQRQARGWTVRELALKLGLNESAAAYISQLEAGQKTPNESTAQKLAEIFQDESGVYGLWAQLGRRTDALTATRAIANLAEILQDPRLEESLRGVGDATMITASPRPPEGGWPPQFRKAAVDASKPPVAGGANATPRRKGFGETLRRIFADPSPERRERKLRSLPLDEARRAEAGELREPAPEARRQRELRSLQAEQDLRAAAADDRGSVPAELGAAVPEPRHGPLERRLEELLPERVPARADDGGPGAVELRVVPDDIEPERFLSRHLRGGVDAVVIAPVRLGGGDPDRWFVYRVTEGSNGRSVGLAPGDRVIMEPARRPRTELSLCVVHVGHQLRWEVVVYNGRHALVMDEPRGSFHVLDGEDARLVAIALARIV